MPGVTVKAYEASPEVPYIKETGNNRIKYQTAVAKEDLASQTEKPGPRSTAKPQDGVSLQSLSDSYSLQPLFP